jgi:phosphate transport system protein
MENHPHTVRSYEKELGMLSEHVSEMAEAAEAQLVQAIQALSARDTGLAEKVIGQDERVNAIQAAVDDLTVRMLAKRQPVASDLRVIVSSQKIAADLERIADYAANIAKNTIALTRIDGDMPTVEIQKMGACALEMLRGVRNAYSAPDLDAAVAAWKSDERINALFTELILHLRDLMGRDPENIQGGTILLFAGRCCERIGDHIKNVAEQVCYMLTGKALPDHQ